MTAAMLAWYGAPLLMLAACYALFLATRDAGHHPGPAE